MRRLKIKEKKPLQVQGNQIEMEKDWEKERSLNL